MYWFKCPSLSSPEVIKAKRAIGTEGVFQCFKVIEEAFNTGVTDLDAETVAGWAQVKIDRACRVLPYAQAILEKSLKISGYLKKSQEISENLRKSQKISENLPDFEPETHAQTEPSKERIERLERLEKELPPYPSGSPPQGEGQRDVILENQAKPLDENQKRRYQLPKDWTPSESDLAWIAKKYPGTPESWTKEQTEHFCMHFWHNGKVGQDWSLAFKNWIRKAKTVYAPRNQLDFAQKNIFPPRDIKPKNTFVSEQERKKKLQDALNLQWSARQNDFPF